MIQQVLTAIIIDDEFSARENLKHLIQKYCPQIQVNYTASNATEASTIINARHPDVIFLDISMPEIDGFKLLKMLHTMPSVVFVTAHEQYAIRAIKAAAVDFLLKPVNVNELMQVEEKLLQLDKLFKENNLRQNYTDLVKNFVNQITSREIINKITLSHANGFNTLQIEDILYLEGENNYTVFHTHQRKFTVSKTLKDYEEILKESGFLRIHKSSIINLRHLKEYSVKNGMEAIMSDNKVLTVSRRKYTEFFDKAKQYL